MVCADSVQGKRAQPLTYWIALYLLHWFIISSIFIRTVFTCLFFLVQLKTIAANTETQSYYWAWAELPSYLTWSHFLWSGARSHSYGTDKVLIKYLNDVYNTHFVTGQAAYLAQQFFDDFKFSLFTLEVAFAARRARMQAPVGNEWNHFDKWLVITMLLNYVLSK